MSAVIGAMALLVSVYRGACTIVPNGMRTEKILARLARTFFTMFANHQAQSLEVPVRATALASSSATIERHAVSPLMS